MDRLALCVSHACETVSARTKDDKDCYVTAVPPEQLQLASVPTAQGRSGTFSPNRDRDLHRWYPYLEGFSEDFVRALLSEFGESARAVHDPFAGTGTTVVVGSLTGRRTSYCEINPFMRLVIEAKTNIARRVQPRVDEASAFAARLVNTARRDLPSLDVAQGELSAAFGNRAYFEGDRLRAVVSLRKAIQSSDRSDDFTQLARVALGAIIVDCSQLRRVGDVRYRRENEMHRRIEHPIEAFKTKLDEILFDIARADFSANGGVELVSRSALERPGSQGTDLVITSPPYLNGTNYFRNTKLELWGSGLLQHENELGDLRTAAVAAGINNVSRRGREPEALPYVEAIASELDEVAYDRRIPELVRRYFSDAKSWLGHLHEMLKPDGQALVDIGDSRFAGVMVKTDWLLAEVAEDIGFGLVERRVLRTRRSKDGTPLEQSLLVLRKKRTGDRARATSPMEESAKDFERDLPHQVRPLGARNWGHGWHSLCSYQGKLKPAIAHVLVREFTSRGEVVLDPMSGAGTIPLEACLQGRLGWGNDLQELGYILTMAKVGWGSSEAVQKSADELLSWLDDRRSAVDLDAYADFGMNGRVPEYFHPDTYREVLAAREFMEQHAVDSWERALVYSAVLHVLHGNRPYALSRRSHPVTPFKPAGDFEYRPLKPRLLDKLSRAMGQDRPSDAVTGQAWKGDLFSLPIDGQVDAVITSPPFAGSTRFFVANWMRLWMAGWEPADFVDRREMFLEHQQRDSLDIYSKFFAVAASWLKPDGRLIMHVGQNKKWNMADELIPRAQEWFRLVHAFDESVAGRESFGISDQGSTSTHQYLFFTLR